MIFLKWGGSLITHKDRPEEAREEVIRRLAGEVLRFRQESPDTALLLGHGSGSFGHSRAALFGTQHGVRTPSDWHGFAEVWRSAHQLHSMVLEALREHELPVVSFPPSASAIAEDGELVKMAHEPIKHAASAGLLPVVMGDVAVDRVRGGSIVSTEQVFAFLAPLLRPRSILLAGLEAGVYRDVASDRQVVDVIERVGDLGPGLSGASAPDVTGGMADKVERSLALASLIPGLEIRVFSASQPESLYQALLGEPLGTLLRAPRSS